MEIYPFPALLPDLQKIPDPDAFFKTVKEEYRQHVGKNYFFPPSEPALFVQQVLTGTHCFTGLVAGVSMQAYLNGDIRGHEETLEKKTKIQRDLYWQRKAIVKPTLLTYHMVPEINELIAEQTVSGTPIQEVHFEEEQAQYRLWKIAKARLISQLRILFREQVPRTYIADGHHRMLAATSEGLRLTNMVGAFYPGNEVLIRDFNRVVQSPLLGQEQILEQFARVADIESLDKPRKPGRKFELTFYYRDQWFRLSWKPAHLTAGTVSVPVLDAQLLNDLILTPILRITNLRAAEEVSFVDGLQPLSEIEEQVRQRDHAMAFCLYPVSLEEMMQWADHYRTLPPKSTWFEPRMKNGLLVQKF